MAATIKQVEEALEASGGFITHAAKKLGITHGALSQRIKKSERLQEARYAIQEKYLDLAETKLISKINDGDLGAICFYLKCKGKQRGYIERQELTGKDGGPIESVTISRDEYKKIRAEILKEDV